jgi:dienelactone hydrolase
MLDSAIQPWVDAAIDRAASGVDVTVTRLTLAAVRGKARRLREVTSRLHMYEEMAERYETVDPDEFYAPPVPIQMAHERVVATIPGGRVIDVAWDSGYEPHLPAARLPFLHWRANATAHARLFRHDRSGAPAVIWLHGYRGGPFAVEQRVSRARELFADGLDVALVTLPFHGARAPGRMSRAPIFPSQGNIGRTNEGFGQMAWDVRGLMAWLRVRGARAVGLMGMSLGGYCTALLATVEASVDFAIGFVPLADITDAIVAHDALRGIAIDEEIQEASRRALAIHRPLERRPVVAGERMLFVGGRCDRITGRPHAESLARHFGAGLSWFRGGHLLQVGREEGFRATRDLIARWAR